MITRILAIWLSELKIALRNRWIILAVSILALFAFVLAFAGSAPTGTLGVGHLTVTIASLSSLSVYLVPLIALLLSFDSISGESERGTLLLLVTYPISRLEIIAGKFLAHLSVLFLAILIGYGTVGSAVLLLSGDPAGIGNLIRLIWSATLLGAAFLGLGFVVSTGVRHTGTAAGLAIAVWLILVVLYDVGLLGALVLDNGGFFTKHVFPWLLIANPADGFRLYNLTALEGPALMSGMAGLRETFPLSPIWTVAVLVAWIGGALTFAGWRFRRMEP